MQRFYIYTAFYNSFVENAMPLATYFSWLFDAVNSGMKETAYCFFKSWFGSIVFQHFSTASNHNEIVTYNSPQTEKSSKKHLTIKTEEYIQSTAPAPLRCGASFRIVTCCAVPRHDIQLFQHTVWFYYSKLLCKANIQYRIFVAFIKGHFI